MREGAGMPSSTAIGTARSRVLADVRQNGCHLRASMEQAAAAGARVVHFPEVALSGCVKAQMWPRSLTSVATSTRPRCGLYEATELVGPAGPMSRCLRRAGLCRCPSPPCPLRGFARGLGPVAGPAQRLHVPQLVAAAIGQRDDVVELPGMPLRPHRPAVGAGMAGIARPRRDRARPAQPPRHHIAAAGCADAAVALLDPQPRMPGPRELVGLDTGRMPLAATVGPAVRAQDRQPAPAAGAARCARVRDGEPVPPAGAHASPDELRTFIVARIGGNCACGSLPRGPQRTEHPGMAGDRGGIGTVVPLEGRLDVVVVGAGFAGLYMLHCLRGLGLSAVAFEAGQDVGGTWYWNRYPGARCDVESLQYSYAFSDDLQQDWSWSERYATQPEILTYARHVADRLDLRRQIRFGTRVTSAVFDEAAERWLVRTDRGDAVSAQFCVMATGCLSTARVPDFPGLETFRGPDLPHRRLAPRTRGPQGPKGGRDRHRLLGDPGDPAPGTASRTPRRLPAHAELQRARAQPPAHAGVPARVEGRLRRASAASQGDAQRHPHLAQRRPGPGGRRGGAAAGL